VQSEADGGAAENHREDQAASPARFLAQACQQQRGDTREDHQRRAEGQVAAQ